MGMRASQQAIGVYHFSAKIKRFLNPLVSLSISLSPTVRRARRPDLRTSLSTRRDTGGCRLLSMILAAATAESRPGAARSVSHLMFVLRGLELIESDVSCVFGQRSDSGDSARCTFGNAEIKERRHIACRPRRAVRGCCCKLMAHNDHILLPGFGLRHPSLSSCKAIDIAE